MDKQPDPAARRVLTIRCSALDLAMSCCESLCITPDQNGGSIIRTDTAGGMARAGTAFHEWAGTFDEDEDDRPSIASLADRYGVAEDELRMLCHQGTRFWLNDLRNWFRGGDFEVPMSHEVEWPHHGFTHLRITGTADNIKHVGVAGGDRLFVHDWKTGWLQLDCRHQRFGYAFLASRDHPDVERIASGVSWVREGTIDWGHSQITIDDVEGWFEHLQTHLRNQIGKFAPGHHCRFCDRTHSCAGRDQYMRSLMVAFGKPADLRVSAPSRPAPEVVGPDLSDMVRRARIVGSEADRIRDVAREYAKDVGGFPSGDGYWFYIKTTSRPKLNLQAALPVLERHGITMDELMEHLTLPVKALRDVLAKHRGSWKRSQFINQVIDELVAADAYDHNPVDQLKEGIE